MTVEEMVKLRLPEWQALEADVAWLRRPTFDRRDPRRILDFSRRYRSACSDLALATAQRYPAETTDYLQQLVADALVCFRGELEMMDIILAMLCSDPSAGGDTGDETDETGDPPRLWDYTEEKPGCAFTRSIGTYATTSVRV